MAARAKNRTAKPVAENPEWTREDFARAKPAQDVLSADVLSAFPRTRGPQRAPTKVPISIRLSPDVVAYFRRTGPGWQSRVDDILKKEIARKR
jgi:uncharacterized protein (DUF4415 family)